MPKTLFIMLLIATPIVLGMATGNGVVALAALVLVLIANPIMWNVRKDRYFNSEQFRALRSEVASVVAEHNDVVNYVAEIRSQGSFHGSVCASGDVRKPLDVEQPARP